MIPIFSEKYGNPSSLHGIGDQATDLLDKNREITVESYSEDNIRKLYNVLCGT